MFVPSSVRSSTRIFSSLFRYSGRCALVCAVALGSASPSAGAQTASGQVTYTITDLGVLPGGNSKCNCSYGNGINASGQVAGYAYTPLPNSEGESNAEASIFNFGQVTGLGFIPIPAADMYPQSSIGYAMNGSGQVTGSGDAQDPFERDAFLYRAGTMNDLGRLNSDDDDAVGNAINDAGQVAGWSTKDNPNLGPPRTEAFLYSNGAMENLGTLPGGTGDPNGFGEQTYAYSINSSGQAVGSAATTTGTYAVLFSGGKVINLGLPNGAEGSSANAINDVGGIAGTSYLADGTSHAFSYSKGVFTDLGTLPGTACANGASINISGQIVGTAAVAPCAGSASLSFLYTPGHGMVNVNSLLPAGSGWTNLSLSAINDKGQITGTGTNPQGLQRAFLLSPVQVGFSTLDAVLQISGAPATTFLAAGRFTLGTNSNGINPLNETAVLQLGGYHIAIPPSSFVQMNGNYIFNGKIGNVTLGMVIRPVAANVFLFGVEGIGAAALPSGYPVQMTLTIGDDTGTEQIQTAYNGPPPTPAELCQYFNLDCGK